MTRRSTQRRLPSNTRGVLILLVGALFLGLALCCSVYALVSRVIDGDGGPEPTATVSEPSLTVAYSPDKERVFTSLIARFNERGFETTDGERMLVTGVRFEPEAMIDTVLAGDAGFQAMTPDSSVWLGQLDVAWSEQVGADATLVGETVRYGVSPVVIAMWEDLARQLGWPDRAVSWQDLLARAQTDPGFRWSHASTSSASGLLATLAEFYAGAGKTRGLTIDDVQDPRTLDYVAELEQTVQYYGEGDELALVERALAEGRGFLDAFVVQEQMIVYYNTQRQGGQERLVALYPVEGVLWADHPLALLETADLTPAQRQVFARFRDFLLSPEAQQSVLSQGYRPADLSIPLEGPGSPLSTGNGVDTGEPQTALQVPNASVIGVVRDVWWYTKRHTNVYLVVDTSGSMNGDKLYQAQAALYAFLDQIQGDVERVGMVQFASEPYNLVPLDELGRNRAVLEREVGRLEAAGDTALLDAVSLAYRQLQELGDSDRINAIVAMTDGRENNSRISLRSLVRQLGEPSDVPVVVFCIAYGADADIGVLEAIAESTGGQVRTGDLETIQDLYRLLSTYF